VSGGEPQSDGAIGGLQNAISFLGKNLFCESPHCRFILDEENRLGDAGSLLESGGRFVGGGERLLLQGRLSEIRIERLESRRREQLARQNRRAPGCSLDLRQLLRASRAFAGALEQELSVDLNDGEEVVELVCNKACCLVRIFEVASSGGEVDRRRATILLC